MNRFFRIVFWTSLVISSFTSIWYALHGTISFHTDIARDFLLIEDIVVNKKITLIGPHSGGIEGVFHGPLWLYLNAPAFFVGNGNPAVVAWFWAFLTMFSIGVLYFVTKKLSETKTAMMATAIYGLVIASSSSNLFNPSGAVFLAPLFFYFFIMYLKNSRIIYLIISLFLIGLIIQFQMAWGGPILILMIPILFRHFLIHKKFSHISSFAVLALPLSTFILFDLRHQFLQLKSVLAYITHPTIIKKASLASFLGGRLYDMWIGVITVFAGWNGYLQAFYTLLFLTLVYFAIKNRKKLDTSIFYIFYFYIGFWILTLPLKGIIYEYYYWAFLPLFCIVLGSLIGSVLKKYATPVFIVVILFLLMSNVQIILCQDGKFFKDNTALWLFYSAQAKSIYADAAGKDFGWYVYTADQYAYSFKYAMSYVQKLYPSTHSYKFQKKPLTYLMIYPSDNIYTSEVGWKDGQVKINRRSEKTIKWRGGSYSEKFNLTAEEQAIQSDSSLLQDLTFR